MRIACVLVAAGTGARFGAAKQFLPLHGKPVIAWAAKTLANHGVLLQPVGDAEAIGTALAGIEHLPPVAGGATRQLSVMAGLRALEAQNPDIVLVHDAARPLIPAGTIEALVAALNTARGAIPAAAVAETLKRRGPDGLITATVARDHLFRAQTPQAFWFADLLNAHRQFQDAAATDDAALLELAGLPVAIIPGSESNIKITWPEDLTRMESMLRLLPRVGTGFDVHAIEVGRQMIICGVHIPCEFGLAGHSDADVGIHALCDAIYGALAEGDIGRHFPPSDATYKNADSASFLIHAAERIKARGGELINADITIICERPKIGPHAAAMMQRLADLLGTDVARISVKATTSERLGFTGRGEGIAAQASVSVLVPM